VKGLFPQTGLNGSDVEAGLSLLLIAGAR